MKLIISGGAGFVATEVIRQSLLHPTITSLVVFSRRPVHPPPGIDASKMQHVALKDYDDYPDSVKSHLAGANACIW